MRYAAIILAMTLIGCTTTRKYQVFLRNDTPESLTIGLTGALPDKIWNSPEDLAISNAQDPDRAWGKVVPPGKTASTPMVKGKFENGDVAFLRIYGNGDKSHLDFDQLLAMSHGSTNRLDLRLDPGKNFFIVRDEGGILQGLRIEPSQR